MKVKTFLSWVGFIAISIFVLFPFYWGIGLLLLHVLILTGYPIKLS